jgi:hypothetical protein
MPYARVLAANAAAVRFGSYLSPNVRSRALRALAVDKHRDLNIIKTTIKLSLLLKLITGSYQCENQKDMSSVADDQPQLNDIHCVWCQEVICELPVKQWPPKYNGKRIFLTHRLWDQKLFHTIFDHHSKHIVAVHYKCKETYYRSTFDGGYPISQIPADYKCLNCKVPFTAKNFYVTPKGQVLHLNCIVYDCDFCHKIIGTLPSVKLGPYRLHAICAAKFCCKNQVDRLYGDIRWSALVADIDVWWPDKFTRVTACLYPTEFRATMWGLLLAIKALKLNHRVPTDVILVIMNMAVSPMDYKIQHGLQINLMPTLLGGNCNKCKQPRALTRFDTTYCRPDHCIVFSNVKCLRGHWTKWSHLIVQSDDCTEYRCGHSNKCKLCEGFIRYSPESPDNWCMVNICNYRHKNPCQCERPMFKEEDCFGKAITVSDDQCTLGNCQYLIKDKTCECGGLLYESSPSAYLCTLEVCQIETRKMVDETMAYIRNNPNKGHAILSWGT